jgi:23S rRNA (guanosine2251-2'-O)-methyltransferase
MPGSGRATAKTESACARMPPHHGFAADAPVVLEGRISIEAALTAGVRPVSEVLAIEPGDRRLAVLRRIAAEHEVPIRRVTPAVLRGLVTGQTHGGVVALAGERRYLEITELLGPAASDGFVVMLDGLEDPYNFGQAVRSLFAAGVDGLVLRARSWESAAAVVTRASAGATELLPTAVVATPEEAADAARRVGLQVACASTRANGTWIHEADLVRGTFLLVGGERRGITRSFIDQADLLLRIPYGRRGAHALGAAVSAALIGFEALRQRRAAGRGTLADAVAEESG